MIWTRRGFLKLAASSAGVVVAGRFGVDRLSVAVEESAFSRACLYGVLVRNNGDAPARFIIGRSPDTPIYMCGLGGGGHLRWEAMPGQEIVIGNGLMNLSDVDLEILSAGFMNEAGQMYEWSPLKGMTRLRLTSPRWDVQPFAS